MGLGTLRNPSNTTSKKCCALTFIKESPKQVKLEICSTKPKEEIYGTLEINNQKLFQLNICNLSNLKCDMKTKEKSLKII